MWRRDGGGGGNSFANRRDREHVTSQQKQYQLDREKTTPLYLRVFVGVGGHNTAEDFADAENYPNGEVQIYTWMDATLDELTGLIKGVKSAARKPNTRISFAFVYPDKTGKNVLREVGSTWSTRRGHDDQKSLKTLRFEAGDILDVAIFPGRQGDMGSTNRR